jgi:CRP-like cAMP-binding protein
MANDNADDLLSFKHHLGKYTELTDQEFEEIITYFHFRKAKKKEVLIKAGDRVNETHWVKRGFITSSLTGTDGKEHIVQFAIENCWITDQDAFYNQVNAVFDVVCFEPSELLSITFEDRERLCSQHPSMEHFFRRKANDSFVKQQKRLLTYLTANARERLDLLAQEYPGILQRVSRKTLAAYLGVTRETLSRL